MAVGQSPPIGDVIIRHRAFGEYTIATAPGPEQMSYGTSEEAVDVAMSFARERHRVVWLTRDGQAFERLSAESRSRRVPEVRTQAVP